MCIMERTILQCLVSYIKMLIFTTGNTGLLIWFGMEFCYCAITYYGVTSQAVLSALSKTAANQLEFAQQQFKNKKTVFPYAFMQI